jgi:hypothetical protein
MRQVAAMLKAIHGSEHLEPPRKKTVEVVEKVKEMKLGTAAAHRLHEVGNPGLHGYGAPLCHGAGSGGRSP